MATKSETTPKKSAIITPSPKLRTTSILCQICSVQPSLYCCPRCSFRTCSLSCCQAHKKRENCNGKRNRAAFCSLHEFTDSQLKSDYHFLEDVLNASSGAKRMLKSMGAYHNNQQQQHQKEQQKECVTTTTSQPLLRSTLDENCFVAEDATAANAKRIKTSAGPQHGGGTMGSDDWIGKYHPGLRKLVHQARHRGVNLLLMPNGMEKRKNNSTKYIEKKDAIFWKIEWIFHHPPKDDEGRDDTRNEEHAEARTATTTTIVVSHRLSENTILKDELEKHLTSRDYRSRLKSFGTKPRDDILLFVKKVPCSTNDARFYSIDGELSVQRMLKGKSVIEFPTIDVVMKGNDENFPKMIKEIESCKE